MLAAITAGISVVDILGSKAAAAVALFFLLAYLIRGQPKYLLKFAEEKEGEEEIYPTAAAATEI